MLGGSVNPHSIYVSTVQTGCMKAEFDSTYPIHLNGIISRDEYRQSINRINLPISSNRISLILAIVFGLSIVIGIAFIIIGVATQDNSKTGQFPPLIGVAMALFAGGSMFILIGLCIIQFRRTARMREIIAEESMKYSSRSPIPCIWRLEITTHCFRGYEDDHNSRLVYHIVIDTGRSTTAESAPYHGNQADTESTFLLGQENNPH